MKVTVENGVVIFDDFKESEEIYRNEILECDETRVDGDKIIGTAPLEVYKETIDKIFGYIRREEEELNDYKDEDEIKIHKAFLKFQRKRIRESLELIRKESLQLGEKYPDEVGTVIKDMRNLRKLIIEEIDSIEDYLCDF